MCQMNVLEAKTNFSKLLMLLETKEEDEVIICKNNKPVAKLTLFSQESEYEKRLKAFGIAAGKFQIPDDINDGDEEIARMFYESEDL